MAENTSTKKTSRASKVRTKANSGVKAAHTKASATSARANAVAREKQIISTVTRPASGFIDFLRTQGVVGLAVGLAIGTVASATVKTIVVGFINPLVQLLIGTHKGLESDVWHVAIGHRTADFQWGAALSSVIQLVATAFVIYLIIHFARLDRLDKKKDA